MRFSTPAVLLFLFASTAQAQNIGINTDGSTPDASAMLHIKSIDRGLLVPNVALTATNAVGPVTAPANSLLVYNTAVAGVAPNNVTPGYYYYETASSTWIPILAGVKGWSILGNSGTTAGTNFIGTTDAVDFVVKTGGTAAANERMRVVAGGQTVLNNSGLGLNTGDVFSVYGTGTTNGSTTALSALGSSVINGYASGNGIGLYGETSSATTSQGVAILGLLNALTTPAAVAPNSSTSMAVLGLNFANSAGTTATTYSLSAGVWGEADGEPNAAETAGLVGLAFSASATGRTYGLLAQTESATGFAVDGINFSGNGTGSISVGNGVTGGYLTGGSGAAMTGSTLGGYGTGRTVVSGVGLLGMGNNLAPILPTRGAGVVGAGRQFGVMGFARVAGVPANTDQTNLYANIGNSGGYFELDNTSAGTANAWAYVAMRDNSGTYRKIHGNGTAGTIVKDLQEKYVGLTCTEAPESLFQDFGAAQLNNGRAHVNIDPIFTKNITVNEKHPLRVFIQLEGDCAGVYVTNKSATSFDVIELAGGLSNTSFTYTIVANRADEVMADGSISRYTNDRFSPAPGPIEKTELKAESAPTSRLKAKVLTKARAGN